MSGQGVAADITNPGGSGADARTTPGMPGRSDAAVTGSGTLTGRRRCDDMSWHTNAHGTVETDEGDVFDKDQE